MREELQQAKRPATMLAGPYGHPLHPVLVTVPIGAWVSSLVFDLASRVVGDPAHLVTGSAWLIAIGVAGALVAACFGLLDLLVIPPGTRAFRLGVAHMTLNLLVTAAYGASLPGRLGQPDQAGGVGTGWIALSVASLALLAVAGVLGGELAYRYGVRVADEQTQAAGYTRAQRSSPPRDTKGEGQ
jgi:uncharacterized membrane protein